METLIPLVLILAGIGFFVWLNGREGKRQADGQPRLATWRLLLAALFGMTVLFSGGCSLIFVADSLNGNQFVGPGIVFLLGGIPFLLACLFLWLCLRRGIG